MAKQKKPKGRGKGPQRKEEIEEREETLDYMSTEELVEHMVSLGLNVTEELALELAKREDAIAPLKEFASDETLESFVRGATTTALNVIAHRYPAHQEEILNHFRMLLADTYDAVFGTLLICEILSFGDRSVLDVVYSAFDEGWVDTFLIGIDDVEDMLNDEKQEYMMFMEKEPLDHFSKANIYHLMEANPPEEEAA